MKLRNKKTGEIIETDAELSIKEPTSPTFGYPSYDIIASYNSLAELNAEWEDYEEPKEHWCINEFGTPEMAGRFNRESIYDKSRKLIGNDFETKEEAEKAVEKLKAWKRLKDKGFRITLQGCKGNAWLQANWGNLQGDYSDVLLLFGGEE